MKNTIILFLCTVFSTVGIHTFFVGGYEVVAEGKTLGFVEDISDAKQIAERFDEQLLEDFGEEALINGKLDYVQKIDFKQNVSTKNELEENISSLSEYLGKAVTLVVDGKNTIAFRNYEELIKTLEIIKSKYAIDDGKTDFVEEIAYDTNYISRNQIYDVDMGVEYIMNNAILNVRTLTNVRYTGAVEFDTVSTEDNTMYAGNTEVIQEGEAGQSIISACVVYINGEETERYINDEEVITPPITQYEKTGTLTPPPGHGTGNFIYPVEGRFTSGYGQRWGRLHGGIDLAAPTGTDIVASDNAEVVFAGYSGSYGLLVKLDHKNGYVTYYAHCSEILVSEGDMVKQGDKIALVGNTGNSTGPHCHFEIVYNNKKLNPLEFLT